jgi:hypothetical protein
MYNSMILIVTGIQKQAQNPFKIGRNIIKIKGFIEKYSNERIILIQFKKKIMKTIYSVYCVN